MTFGLSETPLGPQLIGVTILSFALTLWAVVVAARQSSLAVLERVTLVAIAVFAPFIGPVAVLVAAPCLVRRSP